MRWYGPERKYTAGPSTAGFLQLHHHAEDEPPVIQYLNLAFEIVRSPWFDPSTTRQPDPVRMRRCIASPNRPPMYLDRGDSSPPAAVSTIRTFPTAPGFTVLRISPVTEPTASSSATGSLSHSNSNAVEARPREAPSVISKAEQFRRMCFSPGIPGRSR